MICLHFSNNINEGKLIFISLMTILAHIATSWSLQTLQNVLDKRLTDRYPPTSSYLNLRHL